MDQVNIIGIDLAKHSFQPHGAWAAVAVRKKLSRGNVIEFLVSQPSGVVSLEARASAYYWAGKPEKLGREVEMARPVCLSSPPVLDKVWELAVRGF